MDSDASRGHWIPQAIGIAAIALGALILSLDLFGLTSPGVGRMQQLVLGGAGALLAVGLALHFLERSGRVRLPAWRLPADPPANRGVLLLIAWFALLAGLLDPLVLHFENLVGLRFNHVSAHLPWTSPISYLFWFTAAVGLLALVAHGHWRWVRSDRSISAFLAFLTAACILLLFTPELHVAAVMLIAAGIAVRTFQVLRGRMSGFRRFAARSIAVVIAAILMATGVSVGLPAIREAMAVAVLPVRADSPPNVVLIILDTVRDANLSFEGYVRETAPNLSRRVPDGVIFERAISTSSWSAPSHASLVTGRYPFELTVDWLSPLSDEYPTLAERLAASGYRTGGFLANRQYGGRHTGINRGAHHWDVDRVSLAAIARSSVIGVLALRPDRLGMGEGRLNGMDVRNAPIISAEFLEWVDRDTDKPFFAMLNYFDAHSPYDDSPAPFDTLFGESDRPALPLHKRFDPQSMGRELDGYDRSIAYLDTQLEQLFVELERRGLHENTVIIVTSDHGEQFGEKNAVAHGNSLDYAVIHVPLVMWGPGVPATMRIRDAVSIRDIPATIIDLTGARDGPPLPGASLRRYWDPARGAGRTDDIVFSAVAGRSWLPDSTERRFGNLLAAVSGNLRYGRYGTEADETLFDIDVDPWETHDLADLPAYAQALDRFRRATDSIADDYMGRDPQRR